MSPFLKLGVHILNNLISVLKFLILLVTLKSKVHLLALVLFGVVEFLISTGRLLVMEMVILFLLKSNYISVVSSIGMVLKWIIVVKLIQFVVLSISNCVVLMMITRYSVLLTILLSIIALVIVPILKVHHIFKSRILTSIMVVPS